MSPKMEGYLVLPPEQMSEAYFRKEIIDPWLKQHSEYWIATTGIQCRNGIPDYICVINGVPVFIEAKRVGGVLSNYQINEIARLQKANVLVYVVHPLNWSKEQADILRVTQARTNMSQIKNDKVYTIINEPGNC